MNAGSKHDDTSSLTKLGKPSTFRYDNPDISILEAFPNAHPERDYVIIFEHPEFTSLCPITGQPDFGTIRVTYVPDKCCVESKAFKLYMGAFRSHGSFMESLTNKIADDLAQLLSPHCLRVEGIFNIRGGTRISVRVEYFAPGISLDRTTALRALW